MVQIKFMLYAGCTLFSLGNTPFLKNIRANG